MAIFETTPNETIGFITHFTNLPSILFTVFMVLFLFVCFYKVPNKVLLKEKRISLLQKIFIFPFILAYSFGCFTVTENHYQTMPFYLYRQYRSFKGELLALRLRKQMNFEKFKEIKNRFGDKPQTYVILVGESFSRDHYSLYGYERNTNPLLSKRNDIYTFSNVETPHAQTLLALKKVLSFATFDNMDLLTSKGSIVNYFNDAGFKTFWFSAQERLGRFSTYTSIVAQDANESKFDEDVKEYVHKSALNDYDMKDFYQKALDDPAPKKVIFLHFTGGHNPYAATVPRTFHTYQNGKTDREKKVDAYDNAILFNDFVVNEYINMLKKKNVISSLLFFSDHGEDVRDTKESCFCHHEKIKSGPMLRIPLVLWFSPEYKKNYSLKISKEDLSRPYNTENLIHTMIKMAGLSNSDYHAEKSLF